jgi:hypothetical protein
VQKLVHEKAEVMPTAAKYYRRPGSCELWLWKCGNYLSSDSNSSSKTLIFMLKND